MSYWLLIVRGDGTLADVVELAIAIIILPLAQIVTCGTFTHCQAVVRILQWRRVIDQESK